MQTYIGNVCVSVNPYSELGIYSVDHIRMYYNVNLYELPPHVYVCLPSPRCPIASQLRHLRPGISIYAR